MQCPLCHDSLSEFLPILNGQFMFLCGTRMSINGGFGGFMQGLQCQEARKSTGVIPVNRKAYEEECRQEPLITYTNAGQG